MFIWFQIGNEGLAADLTDDPDTEEALKEFDFLVTAEDGEGAGEARSSGDGTEWGKMLTKQFRNREILVCDSTVPSQVAWMCVWLCCWWLAINVSNAETSLFICYFTWQKYNYTSKCFIFDSRKIQ